MERQVLKPIIDYSDYKSLLDVFVDSVQQELGDQVVSVVLYGKVEGVGSEEDSTQWGLVLGPQAGLEAGEALIL